MTEEGTACLAEIDGLAVQDAGDVERTQPLTGGLLGIFPTQGGSVWRLIALKCAVRNSAGRMGSHAIFAILRGRYAGVARALRGSSARLHFCVTDPFRTFALTHYANFARLQR